VLRSISIKRSLHANRGDAAESSRAPRLHQRRYHV